MSLIMKTALLFSSVLNLGLGFVVYKRVPSNSGSSGGAMKSFAITNLDGAVSGDGYLFAFRNGKYWWTVDGETLSMNAGANQEMTLRLNKVTGRVKSTTIELIDAKGQHCYFTDMNADSIPDKKRIGGDENWQIVLNGEFIPSFAKGDKRYVVRGGTNLFVIFDGSQWKTAE